MFTQQELRRKYDEFNVLYFEGVCPKVINLKYTKFTKAFGRATIKIKTVKNTGEKTTTYRIEMNSLFNLEPKKFDAIFIHEMIHIYWYTKGELKHKHGPLFQSKRLEIEKVSGMEIPAKTETTIDKQTCVGQFLKNYVIIEDTTVNNRFGLITKSKIGDFHKKIFALKPYRFYEGMTNFYVKYGTSGKKNIRFSDVSEDDANIFRNFSKINIPPISSTSGL